LKVAAYERELIGLVHVVCHRWPYLWGRHFVVRTDHYALKYMLDQRLSMVPQHQWISKLFGFDFTIEFRPSHLNTTADALSCREPEDPRVAAVSAPTFSLYDDLSAELAGDAALRQLRDTVVADRGAPWFVVDGLILYGPRVYIPAMSRVLPAVL
jgi:hypothetical protein